MTFWQIICLFILACYAIITAIEVKHRWPLRTIKTDVIVLFDFASISTLIAYVVGTIK